jgi:hypothetical protein
MKIENERLYSVVDADVDADVVELYADDRVYYLCNKEYKASVAERKHQ